MLSDSSRSTTAAESRYRVRAPNSAARNMLVIALDSASGCLGGLFVEREWRGTTFVGFAQAGGAFGGDSWRELAATMPIDVAMMVASAGYPMDMAREIGSFAFDRSIKVSAILLLRGAGAELASQSLHQLRPWTRTLTIMDDESYLADFLHALGG